MHERRVTAALPWILLLFTLPPSVAAQETAGLTAEAAETAGEAARGPGPRGKTIIVPPGFERAYERYHYSPAVKVGNRVVLSGIPASMGESYEEKVRSMFEVAKRLLSEAGAEMSDVIEITTYHVEARDSAAMAVELERFLTVHREYFEEGYPAWTAVGTTALLAPNAVVEMRLEAVIGAGDEVRVVGPAEEGR